jgi:hypothetical protein
MLFFFAGRRPEPKLSPCVGCGINKPAIDLVDSKFGGKWCKTCASLYLNTVCVYCSAPTDEIHSARCPKVTPYNILKFDKADLN